MSLPVLVKSYNFFYNAGVVAPSTNILLPTTGVEATDHQNLMFKIKQVLTTMSDSGGIFPTTAARFVVKSSSDGVGGFGNNDSVDRWISAANVIWNNSGGSVNHSWIVFEIQNLATSTKYQICIDLNSSAGNANRAFTMKFSPSAGFGTANGGADGSGTTAPTATDEAIIMGNNGVTSIKWNGLGATFTSRLHVLSSTDGMVTRVMVLIAGVPLVFWNFEALRNPVSGFTKFGVMNSRSGQTSVDNVMTGRWWTTANETGGGSIFRGPGSPGIIGTAFWSAEGLFNNMLGTLLTVANQIDGNWPMLPIGYTGGGPGTIGRHGTLYDVWFGSIGVATGDDYPAAPPLHKFAQFGTVIVPWDGSIPIVA